MSDLLVIGYISAKYVPLEKTCSYWFPSKDFTRPSMVSVAHIPVSLLVCNTLYDLYRFTRVITADRVSLCVVLEIVSLDCFSLICHRSLNYSGDTVEWRPFNWNVLSCGTSCTVNFVSYTTLDGIESTLILKVI